MDGAGPNNTPEGQAVSGYHARAVALQLLAGVACLYAVRESGSLLAPLFVSALLAYAIEPLVAALCRCRLPRPAAIVVVYLALAIVMGLTGAAAKRQAVAFIDALPATVRDLQNSIERARIESGSSARHGAIERLQRTATEIAATLGTPAPRVGPGVSRVTAVSPPFSVRTYLAGASVAVASTGVQLGAIALLTLLLLLGGEALKRKLIAIAGPRGSKKLTHDVIKAIDRQIERYLVARALISGIVAAGTWLGLWCLGVRQPLVLGLIAGVLNVMPFIGPAVAVALVAIVAFLQFHTVSMAAVAVGVAGVVAAVEGNLISPWLTGRAGEVNTVAVFVSVLFWGWMWDVWGLVLAIPIMVAIKAAADHVEPLQPLGELLGR